MPSTEKYNVTKLFTPGILYPDFTWPHQLSPVITIDIPAPPKPSHPLVSRFWAWVHRKLRRLSYLYYCRWAGVPFDPQIIPLPFGMLLKWSDRTHVEEIQAMRVARAAGLPVPRVICYGEHANAPHTPVSILMTRLPGSELGEVWEDMTEDERWQIFSEMRVYLEHMRKWPNPWGSNRICSISNGLIRSIRVPRHLIGPYDTQEDFNDYLIAPASWANRDLPNHADNMILAKKLHEKPYRIVFTHGDLMHHNILVKDGHVTGFIDWESAGWYPEYWEFTTAWRYQTPDLWWWRFVHDFGGESYLEEMENDRALRNLTNDSF